MAASHGDVYQRAITQVTLGKLAADTTERQTITQAEALLSRIAEEIVVFRQEHWP